MKKYLYILSMSSFLLVGCDSSRDFVEWLSGTKTNTVILSKTPVTLSSTPMTFKTNNKAKIVGNGTHVCISLRGDIPSSPNNDMDAEYKRLLNGISISGSIKTINGKEIVIKNPTQTWSKFGTVEKDDELSACMRVKYSKVKEPSDTVISSIQLVASGELKVNGVYWESTNRWDGNY